jgi:hypothetical protein
MASKPIPWSTEPFKGPILARLAMEEADRGLDDQSIVRDVLPGPQVVLMALHELVGEGKVSSGTSHGGSLRYFLGAGHRKVVELTWTRDLVLPRGGHVVGTRPGSDDGSLVLYVEVPVDPWTEI